MNLTVHIKASFTSLTYLREALTPCTPAQTERSPTDRSVLRAVAHHPASACQVHGCCVGQHQFAAKERSVSTSGAA